MEELNAFSIGVEELSKELEVELEMFEGDSNWDSDSDSLVEDSVEFRSESGFGEFREFPEEKDFNFLFELNDFDNLRIAEMSLDELLLSESSEEEEGKGEFFDFEDFHDSGLLGRFLMKSWLNRNSSFSFSYLDCLRTLPGNSPRDSRFLFHCSHNKSSDQLWQK